MPPLPTQTVLVVEDALSLARTYEEYLRRENYHVIVESTGQGALACLRAFRPSAAVLDLNLPDMDGFQVLQQAHALYPNLPLIVVTADTSPGTAHAAMKEGAFDFILKPFTATRLTVTIRNALQRLALEQELIEWRQVLGLSHYRNFIGQSSPMLAVYRIIDSVAPSQANVFITGESGTGKALAASTLHEASPRHAKPFIAIPCGSESLTSVEYASAAASGGLLRAIREADGGTLFLDDLETLPAEHQNRLLRFLQSGDISPPGSLRKETASVRLIAATNRNPQEEVKNGRLHEELYCRLHVVPLYMPPLRERDDDVLLLADYFLQKFGAEKGKTFTSLAPDVIRLFRGYDWPGNVRQLENVLRTIVTLHEGPQVTANMLPEKIQQNTAAREKTPEEIAVPAVSRTPAMPPVKPLWQVEKETIFRTLSLTDQNVGKAAELLEVSPSMLYRKLQTWKTEAVD